MFKLFTTLTLLSAFSGSGLAVAKEFSLPDANPAVSVTLPNAWKPTETDNGVEATSPDGGAYIAVETSPARGMNELLDADIAFLKKNNVKLDLSSQQQQSTNANGIPVTFLHWSGTDDDGPTSVTLGIFGITDNLLMLLTSWATPAAEKKYTPALDAALSSVHRVH